MNRGDMVKAILQKGMVLSPEMFNSLDESSFGMIMENGRDVFITEMPRPGRGRKDDTRSVKAGNQDNPTKKTSGISVEVPKHDPKPELTPQDYVSFYTGIHNKIRDMLLKRTEATSIDKLPAGNASIIGLVKARTHSGFVLEDPTGEIEVFMNPAGVNDDDVVAVKGRKVDKGFRATEVVFPDIPLTRPVAKMDAKLLLSEKEGKAEGVRVSPEGIWVDGIKTSLPNPGRAVLRKADSTVNILVFRPGGGGTLDQGMDMLRKRHLPAGREDVGGPADSFIIDPIPDIFWLVGKERGAKTYKGVTLVSCGPDSAASIDLTTREVEFIQI